MSARTETRIISYPKKLGIIAGGGDIPSRLITFCKKNNVIPVVIGLQGFAKNIDADLWARIGSGQKIIDFLHHEDVNNIVFIGNVKRPTILTLWPDLTTFIFFFKCWFRSFGDSKLLDEAKIEAQKHGFTVRGVHEFLPELLMPFGFITMPINLVNYQSDIDLGIIEAKELGREDNGQAVIVKEGKIIGRESKTGTNALIKSKGVKNSILVKMRKPQQDKNLDLPTIGMATVEHCIEKKMVGIVIEANETLVIDQDRLAEKAGQHGIFIYGAKA